jgi:hypothetical protein
MSGKSKSQSGAYREGKVFSVEQLPAGFEPIGHLDKENKALHSFIIRECNADRVERFRIDGGKGFGRLYLHRDDISRLEEQWNCRHEPPAGDSPMSPSQCESAVTALCEINNGIAVLNATLRDVVAAVGLVAEQLQKQNEPVGSWRDMNGEVMN